MVVIISRRKTHEEFIEELKDKNPTIEVLGHYINAITKIECKCKKCNKILNITPNNLLSGRGATIVRWMHISKESQRNMKILLKN